MTDAAAEAADERIGLSALAPLGGAAIAAVAVVLLFLDTSVSIVAIWNRSETFTHGFFVLPIFLWLVWRERAAIAGLVAVPEPRMLPLIAGAGAFWLVSRVADVLAGQQLALVLMLVFVIVAFAGREIARTIRFPLLFLLFLAPLGEELVPFLMSITADLTVGAIALTGIPIYREGLFFSLPSGDWSVVEACSGIRYLIASIVLGSLYAHLYIEGTSRKLAFLALSAIVPIAANGVRAFLIVMIGHFSSMKLATGADHLVYGWLFFGVVMFVLFSVGALFRRDEAGSEVGPASGAATTSGGAVASSGVAFPADDEASGEGAGGPGASVAASDDTGRDSRTRFGRAFVTQVAGVALCVALWPLWASAIDARAARRDAVRRGAGAHAAVRSRVVGHRRRARDGLAPAHRRPRRAPPLGDRRRPGPPFRARAGPCLRHPASGQGNDRVGERARAVEGLAVAASRERLGHRAGRGRHGGDAARVEPAGVVRRVAPRVALVPGRRCAHRCGLAGETPGDAGPPAAPRRPERGVRAGGGRHGSRGGRSGAGRGLRGCRRAREPAGTARGQLGGDR